MTRTLPWGLLLCFTHLTILPGCQHIPYFGSTAGENPKELYDHAPPKPSESSEDVSHAGEVIIVPNYENSNAKNQALSTAGKLLQGMAREIKEKEKPNEGVTGIVTLEPGQAPGTLKNVGVELKDPLPQIVVQKKSEFEPIVMALQRMLEGRHQEAIKFLGIYDDDNQELFLRLLPPLTILVKKRMEELSPQDVAVLNKQFQGLIDALRPRSELIVSKMCFCEEVRGYAWYRPLPDNHAFLTSTDSRIGELVQLYVELKNIASEPTKEGEFLTKLNCSLELVDSAGKKVWSKPFEGNETTLRRSARLNDFYSRLGFYVPAIPAGTYQLTLHITDETNPRQRRVAQKSLDFRVTPVANPPPLR
jgi:hypothetical protein